MRRMFKDFTSRCTSPLLWRKTSADATSTAICHPLRQYVWSIDHLTLCLGSVWTVGIVFVVSIQSQPLPQQATRPKCGSSHYYQRFKMPTCVCKGPSVLIYQLTRSRTLETLWFKECLMKMERFEFRPVCVLPEVPEDAVP